MRLVKQEKMREKGKEVFSEPVLSLLANTPFRVRP